MRLEPWPRPDAVLSRQAHWPHRSQGAVPRNHSDVTDRCELHWSSRAV